jgi:hypothetical protein
MYGGRELLTVTFAPCVVSFLLTAWAVVIYLMVPLDAFGFPLFTMTATPSF